MLRTLRAMSSPDPIHPPLRVTVLPRLEGLAPEWDLLVAEQDDASPFTRSWWLDHAVDGSAAIVACWHGDDLVGGAAFELGTVGRGAVSIELVTMAGQGPLAPDHLDLIAAPGFDRAVTDAVLAWLHRPGTRIVDLDGLAAEGRLGRALEHHVIERVGAPFATIGPDLAAYVADRPGQVRSTVQRTRRRFEREGVTVHRVETGQVDAALGRLAALHDGRWSDASDFLQGWTRFAAAAAAGAATGDVVIHELRTADGTVIASELDLVLGGRTAFYQAGRLTDREWRGSGSVLRMAVIDAAFERGGTEYDLLRGDEPYKSEWANGRRELLRVRLPVGGAARLLLGAHHLRELLRDRVSRPAPSTPDRPAPPGPLG